MSAKTYTLSFLGDVQLGRLIDQLMPTHVHCPEEARIVSNFLKSHPHLRNYGPECPWGTALPLLQASDLRLINLETAVTTHEVKWPDKVFNYRMHPDNIQILKAAKIDYAGLANNHTLDFSREGLVETVRTVKEAGIHYAGAVESEGDPTGPAVLELANGLRVHVYAASDHPRDWVDVRQFSLIAYDDCARVRLKKALTQPSTAPPALKIFSVHWGPNYSWQPKQEIRELARFLIDECGVDIIHGHSSHHIQGVETHNGKLIIYGCGDFVDDYALVQEYRNDLSAVWNVVVDEHEKGSLKPIRLEVFPTRIRHFQTSLLEQKDADHEFVRQKLTTLSGELGLKISEKQGEQGQIIADLELTAQDRQ